LVSSDLSKGKALKSLELHHEYTILCMFIFPYPHGAWHPHERKNTKTYGHITSYKKKGRSGHELISTLSSFARHSPIAVSSFPIGSIFSSSNNAIYRTNNETA